MKIGGRVKIYYGEGAQRRLQRVVENLVVNAGLDVVRDLIAGTGRRIDVIRVGTGETAPNATDTALESEIYSQRIDRRIATASQLALEIGIPKVAPGIDGKVLAEEGLFADDTLVARALIVPPIAKPPNVFLTISHDLNLASA